MSPNRDQLPNARLVGERRRQHVVPGVSAFGNRLSDASRQELVACLRAGERPVVLAERFGISDTLVYHYAKRAGVAVVQPTPTRLTCRDCGHEGPLEDFVRCQAIKVGFIKQCKPCRLEYGRKRSGYSPPPTLRERLDADSVPEPNTGCLLWSGTLSKDGYGVISVSCETKRAHRISYEIANGPIPDGLLVLHRCDTPACINPAHLFLGSQLDNVRDCVAKGRNSNGRGGSL